MIPMSGKTETKFSRAVFYLGEVGDVGGRISQFAEEWPKRSCIKDSLSISYITRRKGGDSFYYQTEHRRSSASSEPEFYVSGINHAGVKNQDIVAIVRSRPSRLIPREKWEKMFRAETHFEAQLATIAELTDLKTGHQLDKSWSPLTVKSPAQQYAQVTQSYLRLEQRLLSLGAITGTGRNKSYVRLSGYSSYLCKCAEQ